MDSSISRRHLAILFVAALALKLVFLVAARDNPFAICLTNDESYWIAEANDILEGGPIRDDAFWGAPVYPYLLAAFFALAGQGVWPILILQAILGAVNVMVVAVLASRTLGSTRAAWIAAGLTLLFGPLFMYETLVLKTTVAVLTTNLALLFLVLAVEKSSSRLWFTCGLAFGLLTLLRGTFLLVLPFVLLALILEHYRKGVPVRSIAVWMVGIGCGILPATAHNAVAAMDFVPTTYQGGTMFFIGNHHGGSGTYEPLRPGRGQPEQEKYDAVSIAEEMTGRGLWPSEVTRFWLRRGLEEITEYPLDWIRLMAKKTLLYHADAETMDVVDYRVYREIQPNLWLTPLSFGLLLGIAVPGFYLGRRLRYAPLLGLLLLGSMVSVVTFFVFARYRLPALTLYALFAAVTLDHMVSWVRSHSWRRVAVCGIICVGIFLASRTSTGVTSPSMGYNTLGSLYARIDDLENARRFLDRAVRELPDRGELRFNLGNVLMRQDRSCDAARHYTLSMRDPNLLDAARTDPIVRLQLFEMAAANRRAVEACPGPPAETLRASGLERHWAASVLADVETDAISVDDALRGRLTDATAPSPP